MDLDFAGIAIIQTESPTSWTNAAVGVLCIFYGVVGGGGKRPLIRCKLLSLK